MKMLFNRLYAYLMAVVAFVGLLSSCHCDEVYHTSAVLPQEWGTADTVFFSVQVGDSVPGLKPLYVNHPYQMVLEIRHTNAFPYRELPVRMVVMIPDSTGHAVPRKGWDITCPMADAKGFFDGGTWGSLYQKEFQVVHMKLNFPVPGEYVLAFLPLFPDAFVDAEGATSMADAVTVKTGAALVSPEEANEESYPGLMSLGLRLER